MPQSFSKTIIHTIFSTKNRIKIIDEEIEERLYKYIGTVCNDIKCQPIKIGGYRDHIHILSYLHRPVSQSDFVKKIKTSSSNWIKTMGPKYMKFYWQDGYATFSIGRSEIDSLVHYIENQKSHHKNKTFQDEYLKVLEEYEMDYDLKYIWD